MKRHTKRHAKTPLTSNLPPKVVHCEPIPNIIEPLANEHLRQQLEHEEIQSILEQNTQSGFSVTQMTFTDAILPNEVRQFFRDEQPSGLSSLSRFSISP